MIYSRRWIRPRYLLLLTSLLFSVLLAEGLLRVVYAVTYSGTLEDLNSKILDPGTEVNLGDMLTLATSERLVYQLKPHLDVQFKNARVQTNRQGFREVTLPEALEASSIRIVGIGDSVMFGQGVEESERYMDVLETRLKGEFPATQWQTIAIAAPGYNLVMEVEALRKYALAYEPDLLIYGFIYNDFCLPNFVSRRRSVWSFDSFLKFYLSRSERLSRGESSVALMPRRGATLEDYGLTPDQLRGRDRELYNASYCNAENILPEYQHLAGDEGFYQALEELAQIGREHGIPTIFLSYGSARQVDQIPLPEGMIFLDFHSLYRQYLKKNNYKRTAVSDLVQSKVDHHPSAKGHWLIGTALANRLADLGLVEEMLARRAQMNP